MSTKEQQKIYSLYLACELRYVSLDLYKLLGVAEYLASQEIAINGTEGSPPEKWITVESSLLDNMHVAIETINVDWEVTVDVNAKIRE
jgi:hypothetical protein